MSEPTRSRGRLATAIVLAGLFVSIGIVAGIYVSPTKTITLTTAHTQFTTTTSYITNTTTVFTTLPLPSSDHYVDFVQQSACPGGIYLAPWEVMLGNMTAVQPSNATLPLSESSFEAAHAFFNDSIISFLVPNGTYPYQVLPKAFLGMSGTLTVNGSDVIVEVHAAPVSCTTTTA